MERVKSASAHSEDASEKHTALSEPLQPPLVLRVALRPLRVFALTVLAISSLSVLIVYLNQGLAVLRFNRANKTPEQRLKLVDKYNSYAANFATLLGKPIELFVTAAVQVLMLRFLSAHMLRAEPDRRVGFLALALSAGVGYMISNGFAALNVQQRDMDVRPVILASDLSNGYNSSVVEFFDAASSVNQSNSELNASNPVINTVLRTLVARRQPKPVPTCDLASETADFKEFVQDDLLQFGIPQREWMETMLPEALASKRLRIMINATDPNANQNVRAADLPMSAARAANLFVHSAFLSSQYLSWGRNATWRTNASESVGPERNISTAVLMGALPADPSASELTQRDWFLRESGPLLGRLVAGGTANMATTDIAMELSRTELSPSITFDAITFELSVDPALYTTSRDEKNNETRYLQLDPYQCMPWRGRCLIPKKDQPPLTGASKSLFDAPMQIHALAMCLDENGTEVLQSTAWGGRDLQDFGARDCARTSNTSLLLVSVAKRLVADALVENATVETATGPVPVATNVRKLYTFTVGRLGWTLQNLSAEFRADCDKYVENKCMGLSRDLADSRVAVVGAAGLPLNLLTPMYPAYNVNQRPLRLVQITEPPREGDTFQYNTIAGDILFPHNVKKLTWDFTRPVPSKECSAYQEDRVRLVLNNHMYMETTLQATYTAGMFFLFQDAVAQDVLLDVDRVVGVTDGKLTLQFEGNVYNAALWLSTPLQNTLLTLAGCAVLAVSLLSGLVYSIYGRMTQQPDPLANITSPHVIARAMLDESQFPSLLLHRRVTDTSRGYEQKTVKAFEIQSLLLQSQKISGDGVAASA